METPQPSSAQPGGQKPVTTTGSSVPSDGAVTRSGWLIRNATTLLFTVVALAALGAWLSRADDPLNVIEALSKVILGLGLVIFIHELGHFLAAKLCNVHVETFSIGFGPPLFGICQFKWGETLYKIAWIPLGGYVKMLGENPEEEGEDQNPRSYKNKSVGARMLIISAGVIMNLMLAVVLYLSVFMTKGVTQHPAVVGDTEPGGSAWQRGLRRGDRIRQVGSRVSPYYDDIKREVVGKSNKRPLTIVYDRIGETQGPITLDIVPQRPDQRIPIGMIGVKSPSVPSLIDPESRPGRPNPCRIGSVASAVSPGFEFGDRIIATTNPDRPDEIAALPADPRERDFANRLDYFELVRRMERLNGKPMTFRVQRGSSTADITVPPAAARTLGLRMKMGEVVAVREHSPAAEIVRPRRVSDEGEVVEKGDIITKVKITEIGGKSRRFSAAPEAGDEPLDPVRLPTQLGLWAADYLAADKSVPDLELTVLRPDGREIATTIRWQTDWSLYDDEPSFPDSPLSIAPLGLAYRVKNVIDGIEPNSPAARTGLKENDAITEFQLKVKLPPLRYERWWPWSLPKHRTVKQEVREDQWAYYWAFIQETEELEDVTVIVGKEKHTLKPVPDPSLPRVDRGLIFAPDIRTQKAGNLGEAFELSGRLAADKMTMIYENLLGMIMGRLSLKAIAGPITIARVSFDFAGRDLIEFILFLALININLAVVNFLPIPVLDGGHMVFLVYEWLRGKPPSDRFRYIATIVGLVFILCLMAWGIYLDITRL